MFGKVGISCKSCNYAVLSCMHKVLLGKRPHCWQGTLDVGFGRVLHIPRQLSQQKQRQQRQGRSSNNLSCTPAAIFHFQQVVQLPSKSLLLSAYSTCVPLPKPNLKLTLFVWSPANSSNGNTCSRP